MKRLLLLIPTVTSYHTFLKELMEELSRQGWEVHLACSLTPIRGFDCYEPAVAGTAHHIDFPRGANPRKHLAAAKALRALVAKTRPDLIHAHFSATAFTAALAHRPGWPTTIATIQGLVFPEMRGWRNRVFGLAERYAGRKLDGTWVLSRSDVDALAARGLREKVHLQESCGFGCRLDWFDRTRYPAAESAALGRQIGIEARDFVFVFVGRQVHFKGFDLVVRAFLRIVRTAPRARLLLVGTRDPQHATGLDPAEERALADSPACLAVGWQADVAQYLALAQVNVFPSQREGMPVNLMESLAMGLPAITLDSRGCREVVRDGVDGLVIPAATVESLQAAMERLMQDDGLRATLAANALAGRGRFDRNSWIAEQIGIYGRLPGPVPAN